MAWAKVDDGWWCHPKVMGLTLEARGLWVSAISWSCAQRRDIVPHAFVAMVGGSEGVAGEIVASGLWIKCDEGYRIHDWSHYQERSTSEKRAEAGRKGGLTTGSSKARSGASQANAKQTASQAQAKAQAGTHPFPSHPLTHTREPGGEVLELQPAPSPSTKVDDGFDAWWSLYPRKVDKANARRSWTKITRGRSSVPPDLLSSRLRRQIEVWGAEGRDGSKIPHAATWLNGRRWEDDDLTAPARDPKIPVENYGPAVGYR